jgi:predicted enzyme related to lactoylglutathione lyase
MKVLFVAGYGPIVPDDRAHEAAAFYEDALNIEFERDGEYRHTGNLDGVKHFALWPLSQAAESCFGTAKWPAELPVPASWLEFDVDDIAGATAELKSRGYTLLIENRKEPWGQQVTRLLSPEGQLVGLTYTPWMRE